MLNFPEYTPFFAIATLRSPSRSYTLLTMTPMRAATGRTREAGQYHSANASLIPSKFTLRRFPPARFYRARRLSDALKNFLGQILRFTDAGRCAIDFDLIAFSTHIIFAAISALISFDYAIWTHTFSFILPRGRRCWPQYIFAYYIASRLFRVSAGGAEFWALMLNADAISNAF